MLGEHLPSDSSILIFASTHLLARLVGPDDITINFPTEMFEQAMKQAMIDWTNNLHPTSAQTGGYQYYASAPQPMAFQQPWLTVQQAQPMVQQPR